MQEIRKKMLLANPDVTYVGWGYKYTDGRKTQEEAVTVGVKEKRDVRDIRADRFIPRDIDGQKTDVVGTGVIEAYSNVAHRRPCPPGYSIGHWRITAGTLGCLVKQGQADDWLILSNNHVLANSNDAQPNDEIRQPGNADSNDPNRRIALLHEFVKINFDNDDKDNKKAASAFWKAWKWPANKGAQLIGCPYRLHAVIPGAIEQPSPNLVDAALARPVLQNYITPEIPEIGIPEGVIDFELGDRVHKNGRTTEYQEGEVEVVDMAVKVNYGTGVATYDHQWGIRPGGFSAGGDSGSAILRGKLLGGLLFAGGDDITIGNRITDVFNLLGIRL